jgi:predicted ATPase
MSQQVVVGPSRRPSPITGIRLQNLRAFEDTGLIELGQFNFIFGKNSSGKTTFLRSVLLLRQLLETNSLTGEVPFSGAFVDFGSYQEAVHNGSRSKDIVLTFDCDMRRRTMSLRKDRNLPFALHARVTITLHWNATRGHSQVSSIQFQDVESNNGLLKLTRRGPDRVKVEAANLPPFDLDGMGELGFRTLQPFISNIDLDAIDPELDVWMFRFFESLRLATSRVFHVGPLRDMPERAYRTDQLAAAAGATQSTLGVMTAEPSSIDAATKALNRLGIASRVDVARPAPGYAGIIVEDIRTRRRDNLADVGFGISQVLPIIIRLATATPSSLVLIEQPELHLHPETQAALVDVLVDLADERSLSLLIESHSENMLLRLRRHVASGRLDSTGVRILVADEGRVKLAPIDRRGQVDMSVFPEDFFEEEWLEAVELARAARTRK